MNQFLLKCLLFTTLEMQNHMRSLDGKDGRAYRNELCLDTTNGETIASLDLKNLKLNDKENALIKHWETIINYAKQTDNYNPDWTYGIYQIFAELDTYDTNDEGEKFGIIANFILHYNR